MHSRQADLRDRFLRASMNLIQLADALTACAVADPWAFDGGDFLETLSRIEMTAGILQPPFSTELELNDRFIVVDHEAHVPASSVWGFAARAELEAFILGPAGLTNPFTTFCVAFVDGSCCPFRLLYVDGARDVEFSKAAQLERDPFGHEYPELRLEWSPTAQRRS
ncbi:hypothetical protein [Sorangium cellulosum]|nr:hypothetical protein [Sorangium cellulosum]